MEESQTDIVSTQPQPLSQMSEMSVKNQNKNMSRNEGADSSTVNERPAVMFNTGVRTFTETDIYLVGAQLVHFEMDKRSVEFSDTCRPSQIWSTLYHDLINFLMQMNVFQIKILIVISQLFLFSLLEIFCFFKLIIQKFVSSLKLE